jgi:energy-coupling factor transport system substrate-specific component
LGVDVSPTVKKAQQKSSPERSLAREPWGILALLQFLSFVLIAVLVWDALKEIHSGLHQTAPTDPHAFLIDAAQFINSSLIDRLDRAFSPEFRLSALNLPDSVSVWALVSIGGNFVSALLLFYIAATSFRDGQAWPRAFIIAFAVIAVVLSVAATPLLFATVRDQHGKEIWLDVSVMSFLLFFAYFVVDVLSWYGQEESKKSHFTVLILGIDLPCLITTVIFIFCNQYGHLPAPFTVGVSAGLLTIYSLAFFFLCTGFWANTNRGEVAMNTIKGPFAIGIAVGAALNAAIGFLVQLVKLPIYLDLVGSLLIALIFGPVAGIFAAILGSITVGLITTPITIAYTGTAVGVTFAGWYVKRFGYGERFLSTILIGTLVLGPISSILSVPITTYLFSGITFTGSDYVTALLRSSGMELWTSVATGAFFFDALDKGIVSLLVYFIYQRAPEWLKPH